MFGRFLLILILACMQSPVVFACSCIADPASKTYQLLQKTWYGTKRNWSCQYECTDTKKVKTSILGFHRDWYISQDEGLEGICDGLKYIKQYIPARDNFTWVFQKAEGFNPKKSTSKELREFAKACP